MTRRWIGVALCAAALLAFTAFVTVMVEHRVHAAALAHTHASASAPEDSPHEAAAKRVVLSEAAREGNMRWLRPARTTSRRPPPQVRM